MRYEPLYHPVLIQSFVNKCNNSNRCKLFYLDYKSMLIHKLPQTPYTAFPLDFPLGRFEHRKIQFILHSENLFYERWTL